MTNNELITELLKYDGWEIDENRFDFYKSYTHEKFIKYCCVEKRLNLSTQHLLYAYLTDMNILHRIAVKVVKELFALNSDKDDFYIDMEILDVKEKISSAFLVDPNSQDEHIQLATALVNAIRYISANKAQ